MSGDTFNFNNSQSGAGAINQQGKIVSGDATSHVNSPSEAVPRDFFKSLVKMMGADTTPTGDDRLPDSVVQEAAAVVSANSESLATSETAADTDLSHNAVVRDLLREAETPPDKQDLPRIRRLLSTIKQNVAAYRPVVVRVAMAFGEAWLMAAMHKNPLIAGVLAAVQEIRPVVSETPPAE